MCRNLGAREQKVSLIIAFLKEFVMLGYEVCELVEGDQMLPFQDEKLHDRSLMVVLEKSFTVQETYFFFRFAAAFSETLYTILNDW